MHASTDGFPGIELPQDELEERFAHLQKGLAEQWKLIQSMNQLEQTMVVVPSLEGVDTQAGNALQAEEEQLLCLLLLLRKPRARIIYCTSQPIIPEVVDYHLGLLPGVIPSHARSRFHAVAVHDATPRPLAAKILERPHLVKRIRSLLGDPQRAHLVPLTSSTLERDLALMLGVPVFAADPRLAGVASPAGARRVFSEAGVAQPDAVTDLANEDDLAGAVASLRAARPGLAQVRVLLAPDRPGGVEARMPLQGLPDPGHPDERSAVAARVRSTELGGLDPEEFLTALSERGGIVVAGPVGDEARHGTVEMRISPLGRLDVQAVHEQVRSAAADNALLGWHFPADTAFAGRAAEAALAVGGRLRDQGVLGSFSVAFDVTRERGGEWRPHAVGIHLGKEPAMIPLLTLMFLTDGSYDVEQGSFVTRRGRERCSFANLEVTSPSFRSISPEEVFDIVVRHGLHFDHTTQNGVVLHGLSALTECGRAGLTAVADSRSDARELHDRAVATLGFEADRAAEAVDLP